MPALPRLRHNVGLALACVIPCTLLTPAFADTALNDVQKAATEWARLRSETTRLEKAWDSERDLLTASLAGLGVQADQLAGQRDTLAAQTESARTEIDALTATNRETAARIEEAGTRIDALSAQLIALRPALPPRLSAALELPYRSLASPDLTPAERMRHTMTILNQCNRFNQTFVLSEEILAVTPGGEERLLEVLYWGLAQGCALDRSGGEAFVGRAVDGIWSWQPAPDLVGELTDLIDIHQDKEAPAFVTIPAQITEGAQ
ncbi:DUF3450 family protein [Actomonas aquatica]|uniref:DUF3450 family protein n=1 Tax=Actomonas aquatica TaxID=2866162 RepID=A0ABZ1CFR9_9BACT|nr:DUF3450 family protein [Opitutus sp. WL0086]WRQ90068.1 DUF3450 family protein [Opitutus sp. WL0086]